MEFPDVFDRVEKGFDCVLGNPPWERIKLQEKEFFTTLNAEIANAPNKAIRQRLINQLHKNNPYLWGEFQQALHSANAKSKFLRRSGFFSLTAHGDINTYAIFAELSRKLINHNGRSGIIVPIGIATDNTTKEFFGELIKNQSLTQLIGFENEAFIFPNVHHAFKFCALTITGENEKISQANFTFFCRNFDQINQVVRHFKLSREEMILLNPNTFTCPVFRTNIDTELTEKVYNYLPVFINESTGENIWNISFMSMFHMSNDSHLFFKHFEKDRVPLYEAKMIWQFDHRFGTYEGQTLSQANQGKLPEITEEQHQDFKLSIVPRYWIDKIEVENLLKNKWDKNWLLGYRDITSNVVLRTAIFSILPKYAIGGTINLLFPKVKDVKLIACLLANLNSLVFDYITRQKIGGTHLSQNYFKQLPIIAPDSYSTTDINYILPRVLELFYTAWDVKSFADDLWHDSEKTVQNIIIEQWNSNHLMSNIFEQPQHKLDRIADNNIPLQPFIWNDNRRIQIRAELDAYFAYLYGLTLDEIRYIIDPEDVYGSDFPGETFRVLKEKEIKQFSEYRTKRLVIENYNHLIRKIEEFS